GVSELERRTEFLLEKEIGVGIVVVTARLAVAGRAVERLCFGERATGVEDDAPHAGLPRMGFQRFEQAAREPEPAGCRRYPHALDLGGRGVEELQRAPADGAAIEPGDEDDAGPIRRRRLARIAAIAGIEASLEAPVEFPVIGRDALLRVGTVLRFAI